MPAGYTRRQVPKPTRRPGGFFPAVLLSGCADAEVDPGASPPIGRGSRRDQCAARDLAGLGVELYATDGTREHLLADGIDALPVRPDERPATRWRPREDVSPAVYAGILARRDRPEELAELAEHGIGLLDIVVVTVKPFAPQVGERRLRSRRRSR